MKEIKYSAINDPLSWNTDIGVINFATPEDAKRAELLMNRIQDFYSPPEAGSALPEWKFVEDGEGTRGAILAEPGEEITFHCLLRGDFYECTMKLPDRSEPQKDQS